MGIEGGLLRLSRQQLRLLAQYGLGEMGDVGNLGVFRFSGRFRPGEIREAMRELIRENEALRTSLRLEPGLSLPLQVIEGEPLPTAWKRWEDAESFFAGTDAAAADLSGPDAPRRSFHWNTSPQWNFSVRDLAADGILLSIQASPLCCDAQSLRLLAAKVHDRCRVDPAERISDDIQYGDYAVWQDEHFGDKDRSFCKEYLDKISTLPGTGLSMPLERARALTPFARGRVSRRLPRELFPADIRIPDGTLGSQAVFVACFGAVAARMGAAEVFTVGVKIDGRNFAELTTSLGAYEKYLPISARIKPGTRIGELLRSLETGWNEGNEYQDFIPFKSAEPGDEMALLFEWSDALELVGGDCNVEEVGGNYCSEKFKLKLELFNGSEGRDLRLHYDARLFEKEAAEFYLDAVMRMLDAAYLRRDIEIGRVALFSEGMGSGLEEKPDKPWTYDFFRDDVISYLERAGNEMPDSAAIGFGDNLLSYGELRRGYKALGAMLVSELGQQSLPVGIHLGASPKAVICMLACLDSGYSYVPLDPSYPSQRLESMVQDSGIAILISDSLVGSWGGRVKVMQYPDTPVGAIIHAQPAKCVNGDESAYIIFTSGSTGRPKGVVVSRRNLAHSTRQRLARYPDRERFLLLSPVSFDSSVAGIFGTLCGGGNLIIFNASTQIHSALWDELDVKCIESLLTLPSFYASILDQGKNANALRALRSVIVAGESCPGTLVSRHISAQPRTSLSNEYGPTEGTVWSTAQDCLQVDPDSTVPIGRPINGVRIHILDEFLNQAPPGMSGEIYIGGHGVASGYSMRPELTAAGFLPDPFGRASGARIYRTGDRGRRLLNGAIEFLGRIDGQVKVNGFRVELQEVEACILAHAGVKECVAVLLANEFGDDSLVAFVVPAGESFSAEGDLARHIEARLPKFMVPGRILEIAALPRTVNGKVDHAALRATASAGKGSDSLNRKPRSWTEKRLAELWSKVLGLEACSIDDDFFANGGDSIKSLRLCSMAKGAGLEISLRDLMDFPTISGLTDSKRINTPKPAPGSLPFECMPKEYLERIPDGVLEAIPLSAMQAGMVFHSDLAPQSGLYLDVSTLRVRSLWDEEGMTKAVSQAIDEHPILRSSLNFADFPSPVFLIHNGAPASFSWDNLSKAPRAAAEDALENWLQDEGKKDFDLGKPPLVRFHCHLLEERLFQFSMTSHHAVLDGWSAWLLMEAVLKKYTHLLNGMGPDPSPSSTRPLRKFVLAEQEISRSGAARKYWSAILADAERARIPIPEESKSGSFSSTRAELNLGREWTENLKRQAKAHSTSAKSLLLAAHAVAMGVMFRTAEVTTGLVVNGRPDDEDPFGFLGMFLNSVPLVVKLSQNSWIGLAKSCHASEMSAFPFRLFPLAEMQKMNQGKPPFAVLFNCVDFQTLVENFPGTEKRFTSFRAIERTDVPLTVEFSLGGEGGELHLSVSFRQGLFTHEAVLACLECLRSAVEEICKDPLASPERFRIGAADILAPQSESRPVSRGGRGFIGSFLLEEEFPRLVKAVAQAERVTPQNVFLCAFKGFIHRLLGYGEAAVMGSTLEAREPRPEDAGGNPVLQGSLDWHSTFRELLGRTRGTLWGADEPKAGHASAFHGIFTLLGGIEGALSHSGSGRFVGDRSDTATPAIVLTVNGQPRGYRCDFEFEEARFEANAVAQWPVHFGTLLRGMLENPGGRIRDLPFLAHGQRQVMIEEWNRTGQDFGLQKTLPDWFGEVALLFPDAIAVAYGNQCLSYGELERRSNRLGHLLREKGVGPESFVGLLAERSLELMVGLMGILKAGGAWVPMDPAYPSERLQAIEGISKLVLTLFHTSEYRSKTAAFRGPVWSIGDLPLDSYRETPPESGLLSSHPAYVMFTSGSTGVPKGVTIPHKGLANYLHFCLQSYPTKSGLGSPVNSSIGFDATITSMLSPLVAGKKVTLLREENEIESLADFLREQSDISLLKVTPAHLSSLLPHLLGWNVRDRVRALVIGGEALYRENLEFWRRNAEGTILVNEYGPTEAVVGCCVYEVPDSFFDSPGTTSAVPIGRPIANMEVYVLDANFEPVPPGGVGELYLGGVGLAIGYLNQPHLTAQRFLPHPFAKSPGKRVYKTGDAARFRVDGILEYMGRLDRQVKVRGFRIELGEVEAAMLGCEGVTEAVAQVCDSAEHRILVGYAAGPDKGDETIYRKWRSQLMARLPEYMIPTIFEVVPSFSRTPSGKIDRKALPQPRSKANVEGLTRFTPVEEVLANIWSGLIGWNVDPEQSVFEAGAHSIVCAQCVARIRKAFRVEFPLREIFEWPTIRGQAQRVEMRLKRGVRVSPPALVAAAESEGALSFAQERLWFLHQLEGASNAYHVPFGARIHGSLNEAALEQGIGQIIGRHEVLRVSYRINARGRTTETRNEMRFVLPMVDLGGLSESERERQGRFLRQEELMRPFDLSKGPVVRARLMRIGDRDSILQMTLHHIATDAWSMGILSKELNVIYEAFANATPSPLAPLALQYRDYAIWQRLWLQGGAMKEQLAYWSKALDGAPKILDFPKDHSRPFVQGHRGARHRFLLNKDVGGKVKAMARREGATSFMVFLAAFQVLLHRLCGQDEIVVGSPVANRPSPELEGLVGCFVNTLALRVSLAGNPSFSEALGRVRAACLGAYANQDLPFEALVAQLQPQRHLSHAPLFQAMFVFQNAQETEFSLPGVDIDLLEGGNIGSKFDLLFSMEEEKEGDAFGCSFEYDADLFEAETITRWVSCFDTLLRGGLERPEVQLQSLDLLSAAERNSILENGNRNAGRFDLELTVVNRFRDQAGMTPEAIAVVFDGQHLSYSELDRRSNQLGHLLREKGVGPESFVGLLTERSLDMVVGLWGILKAGGAYLPLEPAYPKERLWQMVEDAHPVLILAQSVRRLLVEGAPCPVLVLETLPTEDFPASLPDSGLMGRHPVSALFTSGSTGRPKGVVNLHSGLVNYLCWRQDACRLRAGDVLVQKTAFSFDVSAFEFFWPLLHGAKLVMCLPGRHGDIPYLEETILREGVVGIHFVPSMLGAFMEERVRSPGSLRQVYCSGEALTEVHRKRFFELFPQLELYNFYGPTEASVEAVAVECSIRDEGPVPIGRPIANVEAYVLDARLEPVPAGMPGELHLGGAGLGRSYLNRSDLTADRFVPHPFSGIPGRRLYKTGDIARYRADGMLEFLGRMDNQVKVRGFRIELGEVEAALLRCHGVRDAAVAVEDRFGEKRLVGYVVAGKENSTLVSRHLQSLLKAELPEYMVPNTIHVVASLPKNSNGKLARHALPGAVKGDNTQESGPRVPLGGTLSDLEEKLLLAWGRILNLPGPQADQNFFDAGGTSFSLLEFQLVLEKSLGIPLPISLFFTYPNIRELSAAIAKRTPTGLQEESPSAKAAGRANRFRERLATLAKVPPLESTGNHG